MNSLSDEYGILNAAKLKQTSLQKNDFDAKEFAQMVKEQMPIKSPQEEILPLEAAAAVEATPEEPIVEQEEARVAYVSDMPVNGPMEVPDVISDEDLSELDSSAAKKPDVFTSMTPSEEKKSFFDKAKESPLLWAMLATAVVVVCVAIYEHIVKK